ncbi:MAG TPA: response regulator [Candidatus Saccharimonadales bacterium]|nr:response regulator [Candidatus Saccharimonadales bacterium]
MANVLLVEPDIALARTYVQALQHVGHEVVHVVSAQDAIMAADQTQPDVVVLELRMAVHDGIEFLHEFRSYPEWQGIPVVVNSHITSSSLAPVQTALQGDLGVVATLYKPRTSLQQLISQVNQQVRMA